MDKEDVEDKAPAVAKPLSGQQAPGQPDSLSFEQALERLEETVAALEDGRLSLTESLEQYEQGVAHLRRCHDWLARVERKIELLSGFDAQGKPITTAWDDRELTLDQKAAARSERRSDAPPAPKAVKKKTGTKKKGGSLGPSDGLGQVDANADDSENSDMDDYGTLF